VARPCARENPLAAKTPCDTTRNTQTGYSRASVNSQKFCRWDTWCPEFLANSCRNPDPDKFRLQPAPPPLWMARSSNASRQCRIQQSRFAHPSHVSGTKTALASRSAREFRRLHFLRFAPSFPPSKAQSSSPQSTKIRCVTARPSRTLAKELKSEERRKSRAPPCRNST